jgi:hypothetical protein
VGAEPRHQASTFRESRRLHTKIRPIMRVLFGHVHHNCRPWSGYQAFKSRRMYREIPVRDHHRGDELELICPLSHNILLQLVSNSAISAMAFLILFANEITKSCWETPSRFGPCHSNIHFLHNHGVRIGCLGHKDSVRNVYMIL